MILVVLVIFVFLRNVPATIIPSLSVPLSLVGTFAVMYLLGFSLNNLSLMSLTIAAGFVVDDAIVMIENIARYVEKGDSPMEAALKGSEQIGFTIISLTISLIAVLIPLLFMGDVVGRLFREFAITLAVTILISAVVSLTLVPMMCAKLVRHRPAAAEPRVEPARRAPGSTRSSPRTRRLLNWVLDHQAPDPRGRGRHARPDGRALRRHSQGLLPRPGHGPDPGITEAPAVGLVRGDGAPARRTLADAILKDPDVVSLSSFIGVDGANTTLNTRPDAGQPEAARATATPAPRPDHQAPAGGGAGVVRDLGLPAAGPGPDDRRPGEPHPVPVRARERGPGRPGRMDRPLMDRLAAAAGAGRRRDRPGPAAAWRPMSSSTATRRRASASPPPRSTTRSTMPSASGSSRRSSPSPTSTG